MTAARSLVIDRNKRIAAVMQSWMGLSLLEAFDGWRCVVETSNSQSRREERRQLKEERLQYEDAIARYEYEKIDVSLLLRN